MNKKMSARSRTYSAARAASVVVVVGVWGVACGTSSTTNWGADASVDGSGGGSGGSASSGSGSGGGSGGSSGAGSSSGSTGSSGGGTSSGSSGSSSSGSSTGSSSGSGSGSGSTSSSGVTGDDGGGCTLSASNVRVTEITLGSTYLYQETDANGGNKVGLAPLQISPLPSGGSRLGYMGNDGMAHIVTLDATDNIVAGSAFSLPAFDFQDIYADATGGTVLVSRNALGGAAANLNCGNINNLCGLAANYPTNDPCWDMYLVRFDGSTETWAAKVTDTTASLPAYGVSATSGGNVIFIWWYAHNGRIVFDGTNYGAYFGAAITVPNQNCCNGGATPCPTTSTNAMGVNIHQGDRLKIVNQSGAVQTGGFSFGCSHSSFERLLWDGTKYVGVCNNDAPTGGQTGKIAFAPNATTIYPVNELNTDLGAVAKAGGGGYWVIFSNLRTGQAAGSPGLDDVHLVHTTTGMSDKDITLASDTGLNDRAPHLTPFGTNRLLAGWETSAKTDHLNQNDTTRKLYLQAVDATTGTAEGTPYNVPGVMGSRYQDFRTEADNSVIYAAPGSDFKTDGFGDGTGTKVKIMRVTPCQ